MHFCETDEEYDVCHLLSPPIASTLCLPMMYASPGYSCGMRCTAFAVDRVDINNDPY